MRAISVVAVLIAMTALSACSGPQYILPSTRAGTATIQVVTASRDLYTDVWIFLDEDCDKQPGAGRLVLLPDPVPRTVVYDIEAGRELFVRVHGYNNRRYGNYNKRFYIVDGIWMIRFKPVAGRTYRLIHSVSDRDSSVQLFDVALGKIPDGARGIPAGDVKESCLMKSQRWED